MNEEQYLKIKKELEKGTRHKNYKLKNGQIYRNKNEKLQKVLKRFETETILQIMHNHLLSAHLAVKTTFHIIFNILFHVRPVIPFFNLFIGCLCRQMC